MPDITPRDSLADNLGWVIERYINSRLHYWNAGSGGGGRADGFTDRHEDAVRFCREEDASVVLARICGNIGRVAQHAWVKPSAAASDAA